MKKFEFNGAFCALGIFGLSVIAYPFSLRYTELFSTADIISIFFSPATIAIIGCFLLIDFIYVRYNYSILSRFLRKQEINQLDLAQKILIGFPRNIIVMSLIFVFISFQLVLFLFPAYSSQRLSCFLLSFANATFLGIPLYILFYQHIEKWASPIPYTAKYVALKLSVRILLVVMFNILAVCFFLIITTLETVKLYHDINSLTAALTFKSIPIVIFAFIIGVFNIVKIMKGMNQRIEVANAFAYQLAEGNLSGAKFKIMPRDEFGTLASALINVRERISSLILSTKENTNNAVQEKNKLLSTSESSRKSVLEVESGIEKVNVQVGTLDSKTDEVLSSMNAVSDNIDNLNEQIVAQSTHVEESTAAVTEMITSLKNISTVTSNKLQATIRLTDATAAGRTQLDETVTKIKAIDENVSAIISMVATIQKIAAQTNLLAMNAAIEAAHAGDYGKGFAVVADEIRKLAETAAKNSKQIGTTIKGIITLIGNTVKSGDATSSVFGSMRTEISGTIDSLSEIEKGVNELMSGGSQILASMTELREISSNISSNSSKISKETVSVQSALSQVKSLSDQTRTVTASMMENTRKASVFTHEMTTMSNEISEITDRISGNLNAFKTSE